MAYREFHMKRENGNLSGNEVDFTNLNISYEEDAVQQTSLPDRF